MLLCSWRVGSEETVSYTCTQYVVVLHSSARVGNRTIQPAGNAWNGAQGVRQSFLFIQLNGMRTTAIRIDSITCPTRTDPLTVTFESPRVPTDESRLVQSLGTPPPAESVDSIKPVEPACCPPVQRRPRILEPNSQGLGLGGLGLFARILVTHVV